MLQESAAPTGHPLGVFVVIFSFSKHSVSIDYVRGTRGFRDTKNEEDMALPRYLQYSVITYIYIGAMAIQEKHEQLCGRVGMVSFKERGLVICSRFNLK